MFDDFDKTFPKFKRLPHQVFLMDLIGIGWLSLGWLLVAIFSLFPGRISSLVIEAILYTCTALAILLIAIALAIRLHFKQMSPGLNIPEQLPKPGVNKMFGLSRLLLIIAAILMPFWMLSTLVVV
jgi:vacuolar-type H+-ATPase subunit I/STV1